MCVRQILEDPAGGQRQHPLGVGRVRALCVAVGLGALALSLAGSTGALVARRATGTDITTGLPQTALVIGSAVAVLGISQLASRTGRGLALTAGLAAAVAGALAAAVGVVVSSLPLVLLGNVLIGAANAAVMLARYAAADLVAGHLRARAMGVALAATAAGAVTGPNLLVPAGWLAASARLPDLVGPYLVGAVGFAGAAVVLARGLPPHDQAAATPAAHRASSSPLTHQHRLGLAVLVVSNAVMVFVMTVLPLQLHRHGDGLGVLGVVTSVHIAAMFGPAPVSAWLAGRLGPAGSAAAAGGVLLLGCCLAAVGAGRTVLVGIAMAVVGLGWNMALVSGSLLLTIDLPASERARREGWGELGMAVAAAGGAAVSGVVMSAGGYSTLAGVAAVAALLLLAVAVRCRGPRGPQGRSGEQQIGIC